MIQRITRLSNKVVQGTALKLVQKGNCFTHPENVLAAVFGDSDEEIRTLGMDKVLSICGKFPSFHLCTNFKGEFVDSDDEGDHLEQEEAFAYINSIY